MDNIFDNSCFDTLLDPIFEYRFHLEPQLNGRDINCPMPVNFRLGNTCYKFTENFSNWKMARAECWSYGGELAFPLPDDDAMCGAPIYGLDQEEVT